MMPNKDAIRSKPQETGNKIAQNEDRSLKESREGEVVDAKEEDEEDDREKWCSEREDENGSQKKDRDQKREGDIEGQNEEKQEVDQEAVQNDRELRSRKKIDYPEVPKEATSGYITISVQHDTDEEDEVIGNQRTLEIVKVNQPKYVSVASFSGENDDLVDQYRDRFVNKDENQSSVNQFSKRSVDQSSNLSVNQSAKYQSSDSSIVDQSTDENNDQSSEMGENVAPVHTKRDSCSSSGSNASENDQLGPLTRVSRLSLPSLALSHHDYAPQFGYAVRYNSSSNALKAGSHSKAGFHTSNPHINSGDSTPSLRRYRRHGVVTKPLDPDGPYFPQGNITRRFSTPGHLHPDHDSDEDRSSDLSSRRYNSNRRFSDLRSLTATIGSQIHGSLLSLAGTYDKAFKSDQMVSLSFRSLETFIRDENISGLRGYLSTRTVIIDDRDDNGATALILAAQKGLPDFCSELIQHGADIHAEDNDQWCALITAAREGHSDVVATLLDHGANVHQKEMGGWTALMWAAYKGHSQLAHYLLDHGADPNTQGPHHMTSLIWAAGRGHTPIVKDLLKKGAKVNIGDKFGTTPLIWACRKGYTDICQALLEHGANTDATGMYCWTALLVATRGNYVDLVKLLLDHRPNVNALDKDGGTALTIACKEGYTEIAQALLFAGAYVNIQDRNGDSNLIYAARGGHRTVVEALMKKYADVDLVGKEKKTALYWAVEKGHSSVVKLLLTANPDLEHTTKDGDTALLRAVRSKNSEIVQLLIDKRCKVSVADKRGDTCLHIAMRGRSKRIVEILLRNPKNSQMLYRPNKAGETPYNIDLSHQKTILGQIFGARRLNTNEDNENMLGYDLYSSSLADILSEPSLSMPIAVGLYAKWGSGKSFLIRKLKEEMRSFARQWVEPLFTFSLLVFLLLIHISVLVGLISAAPTKDWRIGLAVGGCLFVVLTLFLVGVWKASRKYEFHPWYWLSVQLEKYMTSVKLVMQVIFCSPPGLQHRDWKGSIHVKPLKFIFAEGTKPSSTAAGESSVVQMIGSLFDKVECEYGVFSTRFYRAFRPKPQSATSPWKYRSLCCIPYIVIYFVTILCTITVTVLAIQYGFHEFHVLSSGSSSEDDMRVIPTIQGISEHDHIDDDEDMSIDSNENDNDDDRSEDAADPYDRPYHGWLINPLLYTSVTLIAVVLLANLHTIVRMLTSLMFSHRRQLRRAMNKLDTLKAEGYLHTLKNEVTLMVDMIKCLDAFSEQQTRLVVIVDGLDSSEQDKVLSVLDAVHTLFTDTAAPFIILLAIDPHIITKAVEMHVHRVFNESNISGHDYLRNIVHLPFYLQNAGLRKVKQAQTVAEKLRGRSSAAWLEVETDSVSMATTSAMGGISHIPANRRLSAESSVSLGPPGSRRNTSKGSRRLLKQSDSVASSIGSNMNRVGGAQDLTKVLLTDDYFSDINPRSMRRLMNVVYITGRLLKAFHIDFNWYHLASWINITEQWPYRASWIILYHEHNEDTIDEKVSLKSLYEKVKSRIPISKDMEPLLEMDKDEKKLETFLSMHKSSLHVSELKMFLPFTINLDPFIRKVIKEDQNQFDDSQYPCPEMPPWSYQATPFDVQSKASTLSKRQGRANQKISTGSLPHGGSINPLMWGYPGPTYVGPGPMNTEVNLPPPSTQPQLPELNSVLSVPLEKHLSFLSLEDVCDLLKSVVGMNSSLVPIYQTKFRENNINGQVLAHCDLDDLKKELHMSFGDWELLKMVVMNLRERPMAVPTTPKPVQTTVPQGEATRRIGKANLLTKQDSIGSTRQRRSSVRTSSLGHVVEELHESPSYEEHEVITSPDGNEEDDDLKGIPKIVINQLNMEEQMIFGALQTLNEEAYEDAIMQQESEDKMPTSYTASTEDLRGQSRGGGINVILGGEEIDVMYLQSSPLLPHRVVAHAPEGDNISIASSSFSIARRTPKSASPRLNRKDRQKDSISSQTGDEMDSGGKGFDYIPPLRKMSETSTTGRFTVTEDIGSRKDGILTQKKSSTSSNTSGNKMYPSVTFAEDNLPGSPPVLLSGESEGSLASPRSINSLSFRKNRPKSLNLSSPRGENPMDRSPDESAPLTLDESMKMSLTDITMTPKSKRAYLAQQLQSKSINKVKKITNQIRRAMAQDTNSYTNSESDEDEPEASPLVMSSSVTLTDLNNASFSPGSIDIHSPGESEASPSSGKDRETHV